ncbi:hypothetical protein [Microvirga zambiensis]|uniref:glycine-rich domain-containing protein n=1 Tax=Microvirga zambiensis TaxID=1402137 RepID=UPI00191EAB0D|nr:hypothetical protein [Microvirga zambiensis]
MKYQPPVGGAANDPYVNRNLGTGTQGSRVPAEAIEHHLRELHSLIEKSGLTPSATDLLQLLKSVRSQALNWRTIGGTANALTMTLDPAPASYADLLGVPLRGLVATTNTADAPTINVNGLGAKQITRRVAGALANAKKGDLPAGSVVELFYNGTSFEVLNPGTADITNSFTTIQAYTVPGSYTFVVPAGIRRLYMEQVGGGGGGGGGNQGAGGFSGGGGGAGGYVVSGQSVNPGDSVSITVGDGGAGGAGTTVGGQGAAGQSSVISLGGSFTITAAGGGGGNVGGPCAPGNGGAGTGGASNSLGIAGGSGQAGLLSAGVTWVFGGLGASSFFGGGGSSNSGSAGSPGPSFGSGGGGGWCQSGSNAYAGGKGGVGAVIIRY